MGKIATPGAWNRRVESWQQPISRKEWLPTCTHPPSELKFFWWYGIGHNEDKFTRVVANMTRVHTQDGASGTPRQRGKNSNKYQPDPPELSIVKVDASSVPYGMEASRNGS